MKIFKEEEKCEEIWENMKTNQEKLKKRKENMKNKCLSFSDLAKIHRITRAGDRITHLALQCLDSSHTIHAAYYSNIQPFEIGKKIA